MVRLKHRYLLVNILYPESDTPTKPTTKDGQVPDVVSFRRPSSDKLNAQLLARMIRDGVADLFGDYGSGMIASSLVGKFYQSASLNRKGLTRDSQVSLYCHIHGHYTSFTRALSTRMGSLEFCHTSTAAHRPSLCHSGCQSVWNHSQSRRRGH
jgi:hypothetical protein